MQDGGVRKYDSVFANDLSEAYRHDLNALCRRCLTEVNEIPQAEFSRQELLSVEIFRRRLSECIEQERYRWYLMPINPAGGWSAAFPVIGSGRGSHPFKTVRNLLLAVALGGLVACGDGKPSESDTKKAVAAKFDGCKSISLSDFKQIGDAAQGNNVSLYFVQATYELSLRLDKDQIDRLKDSNQMINVRNDIKRDCPQVPDDKIYILVTKGADGSGKNAVTFDHQNMWLVRTDNGWQLRDGL